MKLNQAVFVLGAAIVVAAGLSYTNAWTAAPATPPNGNVANLINTGSTAQSIGGNLSVGGTFTAAGIIHSTVGGIKFPDGTTQTTASSGISSCPSGWTLIGTANSATAFCIQTVENATAAFPAAATACENTSTSLGLAHLCTYNEWHMACTKGTGLTNMTNDYEKVIDLYYDDATANQLGVGSGSCDAYNNDQPSTSRTYRCCLR